MAESLNAQKGRNFFQVCPPPSKIKGYAVYQVKGPKRVKGMTSTVRSIFLRIKNDIMINDIISKRSLTSM